MVTSEIIKKVRQRVIQSKKALSGSRAGEFRTRLHGAGYDFDQLRDYQEGDDVRFIDWKSFARTEKLLLRAYRDERSRTTHLLADVSDSMAYGTGLQTKYEVARELLTALILMAEATDDAIGLHFLSDVLEMSIRPKPGKKHSVYLMNTIFSRLPQRKMTSLQQAFEQFGKRFRRKSLLFILSDFIDDSYELPLKILAKRHELALIRIREKTEESILGLCAGIELEDSESCDRYSFDSARDSEVCLQQMRRLRLEQDLLFQKLQIPCCDCFTDGSHIENLVEFVRRYF